MRFSLSSTRKQRFRSLKSFCKSPSRVKGFRISVFSFFNVVMWTGKTQIVACNIMAWNITFLVWRQSVCCFFFLSFVYLRQFGERRENSANRTFFMFTHKCGVTLPCYALQKSRLHPALLRRRPCRRLRRFWTRPGRASSWWDIFENKVAVTEEWRESLCLPKTWLLSLSELHVLDNVVFRFRADEDFFKNGACVDRIFFFWNEGGKPLFKKKYPCRRGLR